MMRIHIERAANMMLSGLAILGTLCIVVTLAGLMFDVRALVFNSGSMSPTIETGALALSRPVDAGDLNVGDIVSVPVAGTRVTHRISAIDLDGDRATLTLKGDANSVEDADPYTVESADRVLFDVPYLGYAVDALSGPFGIFLGGVLAAGLLYLMFRPGEGGSGDRSKSGRRVAVVAVIAVGVPVGLSGSGATPTWAAWTDSSTVAGGAFVAHSVASQARPVCTEHGGLLGVLGGIARLTWTHVDARYEYSWTATNADTGQSLSSGIKVTNDALGSVVTLDISTSLLSLSLTNQNIDIRVRAHLKGSPSWTARTITVNRVRTEQILILGLSVRCGAADTVGPTIGFTAPTNGVNADAGAYREAVRLACGSNRPGCGTVTDDKSEIQSVSYQLKRVRGSSTEFFHASSDGGGIWTSNSGFEDMSLGTGVWDFDGLITTAYFDWNDPMLFTLTVRAVDAVGNVSTASINFTLR